MGRLTFQSPAPLSDCLEIGGRRGFTRKAFLWMREAGDSVAVFDGDDLLAVAFLVPAGDELEFCLAISSRARPRMRGLVRLAHLTLSRLAENGAVITCRVRPGHRPGERMAALAGFRHVAGERWIFERNASDGEIL